jgi:hypothetical protein
LAAVAAGHHQRFRAGRHAGGSDRRHRLAITGGRIEVMDFIAGPDELRVLLPRTYPKSNNVASL